MNGKGIQNLPKKIKPLLTRVEKAEEPKKKPLKRSENNFMVFKEIFVEPKEKKLSDLKEKEKKFEELFSVGAQKLYDKILNIYDEDKDTKKVVMNQSSLFTIEGRRNLVSEPSEPQKQSGIQNKGSQEISQEELDQMKESLVKEKPKVKIANSPEGFFNQQIVMQPPEQPNATIASPLTPGNGYSPSIPLITNITESKGSLKDLLVRAKAGMQAGDLQKESHLAFYLGMINDNKKHFHEAIKHYTKFFTCAKHMEDRIGMALGANRIAVCYYNIGQITGSIDYHQVNLELTDEANTFTVLTAKLKIPVNLDRC